MTSMLKKDAFVVFRHWPKASGVDNQEIGRTATGSNDVLLTTDKSKSFKAKSSQHANDIQPPPSSASS